jgi:hypothetical protein
MEDITIGTESCLPANPSWVENLALEEIRMEESGVVHFNEHLNPQAYLEESSIEFLEAIKDRMEMYVNRFNDFRSTQNAGPIIKMFKISNTINDFMLYRNSLRLVFSRKTNDLLQIGFLSNSGALYSARTTQALPASGGPHEIRAHVGPFQNISWRFNGEIVEIDSLCRHYLTEFIRQSAS